MSNEDKYIPSSYLSSLKLNDNVEIPSNLKSLVSSDIGDQINLKNFYEDKFGTPFTSTMVDSQMTLEGSNSISEAIENNKVTGITDINLNPFISPVNGYKLFSIQFKKSGTAFQRGFAIDSFLSSRQLAESLEEIKPFKGDEPIKNSFSLFFNKDKREEFNKQRLEIPVEKLSPRAKFLVSMGMDLATTPEEQRERQQKSSDKIAYYSNRMDELTEEYLKIPEEVRNSLGGMLATATGEVPFMALYAIPVVGLGVGSTFNIARYYDEGYSQYYSFYLNEGYNVRDAQELASVKASGYAATFTVIATVIDKAQIKVGKNLTTKLGKSKSSSMFKSFLSSTGTFGKNNIKLLYSGQVPALGEALQEVAEFAFLETDTGKEINWNVAMYQGLSGYLGGLSGGQVFGNINIQQKKIAQNKLQKDLISKGVSKETSIKIINADTLVEAVNIFQKEFVDPAMMELGKGAKNEVVEEMIQSFSNSFVTVADARVINKTKSDQEIQQIILNNEALQDDEVGSQLLFDFYKNPTKDNETIYNKYISEKINAELDKVDEVVNNQIKEELNPETEITEEVEPTEEVAPIEEETIESLQQRQDELNEQRRNIEDGQSDQARAIEFETQKVVNRKKILENKAIINDPNASTENKSSAASQLIGLSNKELELNNRNIERDSIEYQQNNLKNSESQLEALNELYKNKPNASLFKETKYEDQVKSLEEDIQFYKNKIKEQTEEVTPTTQEVVTEPTPVVEPTTAKEVKTYPPKPDEDIVVIDESLKTLSDDELDILEKDLNKQLDKLEDKLVPAMTDEGLFQNFTQEEINELINVRRQIDSLEIETFRRQREIIEEGDTAFYTLEDMATDFINIAKDNRFVANSANEGLAKLAILIDIANKNNSLKKVANIIDNRKQRLRDDDEIELFDIVLNNLKLKVNEIKNLQKKALKKQTPLAIAEPTPTQETIDDTKVFESKIKATETSPTNIDSDIDVDIENELEEEEGESEEVFDIAHARSRILNKTRNVLGVNLNKAFTPIRSILYDIDPRLGAKLDKFEFDSANEERKYLQRIDPFFNELKKLHKEDALAGTEVIAALHNGDYDTVYKYISKENVDEMRAVLKDVREILIDAGYSLPDRENYFPNRVKNLEGLSNILGKPFLSKIDKAIEREEAKLERTLSSSEKETLTNNIITERYRSDVKAPRGTKKKVIENITPELQEFYFNPALAIALHIKESVQVSETKKLFGKSISQLDYNNDLESSIANIINDLNVDKKLSNEDVDDIKDALRARFSFQTSTKLTRGVKGLSYATYLGDFENTITQFSEFGYNLFLNGYKNAFNSLPSNKQIKLKDIGIEEISPEFTEKGALNKITGGILTATGFKTLDRFNKESFMEGARLQVKSQLENNKLNADNEQRLNLLFPNKKQRLQVEKDILEGNVSDDVSFFLFSKLLDIQPITLSNMPQRYLEMPTGRLFYTLKTFTIKQLDNFRRQGLDQAIEGFRTGDLKLFTSGFTRLVHLAGLFYLMGIGADALKDLFRRRTFYLNDAAIENLYKLFGFYRFSVEQSLQKGQITDVFWNSIKPAVPIVNEIIADFGTTVKGNPDNLFKFYVENFEKLKTPELIPIIGNYWSNRFGRGAFLEFKKQEQKQKEAEIKAGIRPDPELIKKQKEAGIRPDPKLKEKEEFKQFKEERNK